MTDARIQIFDYGGDPIIQSDDLVEDPGLFNAVLISLFTDARAPLDAELPQNESGRRGWWPDTATSRTGSLLWLVNREKARDEVKARAKQYAEDSLRWLIDSGIAAEVKVDASIQSSMALQLIIKISRGPAKQYQYLWDGVAKAEQIDFGNTSVQLQFNQ